ncbi:MAG: hypothetical protein ACK8QZ_09520 [Anaerolineales bacterium]
MERAAKLGLVELGGCLVEHGNPDTRCLECKRAWQAPPPRPEVHFISDAVVLVQKHREMLSSAIAEYGNACMEYARQSSLTDTHESRYAYSSMMQAHSRIDAEWTRFFVRAQEYCNHHSGVAAARVYGSF